MRLTDEEQRYAKAWAKLRGFQRFSLWVIGPLLGFGCLVMVSQFLAWKSLSSAFGIAFLASAVGGALAAMRFTATFKCPRCRRQFMSRSRFQKKPDCYTCGLPRFAPRNPDPNWKPS